MDYFLGGRSIPFCSSNPHGKNKVPKMSHRSARKFNSIAYSSIMLVVFLCNKEVQSAIE